MNHLKFIKPNRFDFLLAIMAFAITVFALNLLTIVLQLEQNSVALQTLKATYTSAGLEKLHEQQTSPDVFAAELTTSKYPSCLDCMYYPVGKNHSLREDYVPGDLVATNLPGGGQVTAETAKSLQEMFADMQSQGLKPQVNSAYRSYQTQENTFNYWYQGEIARGRPHEEAIERANQYSAMPGESEHQLGTSVDINCSNCSPFDKSINGNWGIWNYLAANAHKYGFIISYPEGKQHLTGYVYEPWHLRYIGKDLATELQELDYQNPSSDQYLEKFLAQKKLF